uniref:Putative secreted protein n=1 Tax=Ixodes ricinus TaxID=34613 RepID=A0A6B0U310_IXORI
MRALTIFFVILLLQGVCFFIEVDAATCGQWVGPWNGANGQLEQNESARPHSPDRSLGSQTASLHRMAQTS